MEGDVANYEAQYHPSAPARPPRDEMVHLPQIASARGTGAKKRAAALARARPGERPAVAWVESAREESPRFGKHLDKPATDQVFESEVSTMHVGLQRAGVEVASFFEETGAVNWAAEQAHRVVCVCLQLGSRQVLTDPDGVARMIARYVARGLTVVVVQPTSPVPTAKDSKSVRVCKRICGDTQVPLFLDTPTAMQGIMKLVAKSYAFVNGRLQRAAVEDDRDEVSAPSRVGSDRRSPTQPRHVADPLPPQADADAVLAIGIIQPHAPEPEQVVVPRAPRFMRPKKVASGAANRRHAAVAASALDDGRQLDLDPTQPGASELYIDGGYCSRCELLEQKLDLVQADPGSQRALQLESQLESLQQEKDDQEQVLQARIVALEKQAATGSRKQEIGLLEEQIRKNREATEAKEEQIVQAAKAEKAKALRQQKFKMARYLTELAETKALVDDLRGQIAKLTTEVATQKKKGNAAVLNKDEEAVSLAMQLADLEVAKEDAEGRVKGLEASLVVEKKTVSMLWTKIPPVFSSSSSSYTPQEYIEAIEGMEKPELKETLLKGTEAGDDAVKDMRERIRHMEVDELRSALRQNFILQQVGIKLPLAASIGGDGGEQKSSTNPALEKVRAQKVADAAAAKQARLIALEKAKAAAIVDMDENPDNGDGNVISTSPSDRSISLAAALASKTAASRWLEQAKAKSLAHKLMADDLKEHRPANTMATEDGGDTPTAPKGLSTFTAGDHLRGVINSRAVRSAVAFKAQVTAQTKAEAMQLKEKAAAESDAENFAAALEYLDAALMLWPDHPVDGNPKIKEARAIAQQRLDGQKLFAKAEQHSAAREFASASEACSRAAELWPENEAIPAAKKSAEDKLTAEQLVGKAEQALVEDAEGDETGLERCVHAYREALKFDPDHEPIQTACAQAEQKLKASELHRQAMEEMERAEFSAAHKSFVAALLLDSELAPKVQEPLENCEKKVAAMQLVVQGDLQLEHEQFDPAIASYSEALELWGDVEGSQKDDMVQKLSGAEEAKAQMERDTAAAAAEAATRALLAKLDEMRSAAEAQLAKRDLDTCISTCNAALVLDQEEQYAARGVILALKEKAEILTKAGRLASYGKEQLAANDFRAVDTLSEALTLDPENKEIADLVDTAARKREAREKQVVDMRKKAEQHAVAEAGRKKVKKAAAGAAWLAAAQHQAADLARHLAEVDEKEGSAAPEPADIAAAAAAAEAASFGPAAVGAARAAARTAIEEGISAEGAAAAGSAAAAVVAAGLGKAAEDAGRKAAAKFKEDEESEQEKKAQHEEILKLKMAMAMYQQKVDQLTTSLQESTDQGAVALSFVEKSSEALSVSRSEIKKKDVEIEQLKLELHDMQAADDEEIEMLEAKIERYVKKEQMMMAILRKGGLADLLDKDGDGSVSKEEADAYLNPRAED